MIEHEVLYALLRQEVVPAMGCTEPAAVALAAAYAASVLPGEVQKAKIRVSPPVLKNGMGVGIPGTGLIGLEIAAAIGIMVADPQRQLEVLADINAEKLEKAKAFLAEERLNLEMQAVEDKVLIEAVLSDGTNTAKAVIRWRHTWLYRLELNTEVLKYQVFGEATESKYISASAFSLRDYYDFAQSASYEELLKLDLGEKYNREIAEYGLREASGISVGKMLMQQIEEGLLGNDIHHYAMALTAAATDARMSGCTLPVISNSGSGNQGLSITLPIIAVAEKLKLSHDKLLRALVLGHLVSVHIKDKVGVLSCLCGCLSAAAGAACGIVLLLGGDFLKVEYAIKNMIGNTTGMVCDGAKEGCSLKVATNTSAAVQSALLANMGKVISSNDGIITEDLDETIANLARFVISGMENADSTILSIMINKKNSNKEENNG
ncbi:MAG: L-serine ammonia-lyase, iron-sulfur-dependent, subunit alpha [Candidatus Cloacimonadaceae bacterium]